MPDKFLYKVGQFVAWKKMRRDWSTGEDVYHVYKVQIVKRTVSEYGALLYQGDNGIWFSQVRIIRELTPDEFYELRREHNEPTHTA